MSIEILGQDITYARAERIYRKSREMANETWRYMGYAEAGVRAVIARDPRLLKALEAALEVIDKAQEEQRGRTMRDKSTTGAYKADVAVLQAYREAYLDATERRPASDDGPEYAAWRNQITSWGYFYAALGMFAGAIV